MKNRKKLAEVLGLQIEDLPAQENLDEEKAEAINDLLDILFEGAGDSRYKRSFDTNDPIC